MGYRSCLNSSIYNINGDIYGYGYQSLGLTAIFNINGNIYCLTPRGCVTSAITSINGNIIGIGESVLIESTLGDIDGTVALFGTNALRNAALFNVKKVCLSFCEYFKTIDIFFGFMCVRWKLGDCEWQWLFSWIVCARYSLFRRNRNSTIRRCNDN